MSIATFWLVLNRFVKTDHHTLGILGVQGEQPLWYTLELPWKNNENNKSCVAEGNYPFFRYISPKRGYVVLMLKNVVNRDHIEIHIANKVTEILGCIAVGKQSWLREGEVHDSTTAFKELMARVPETGMLSIRSVVI